MHLKRWSIPVERTYAAPEGSARAPRSIRAERRVDLFDDSGKLHVHVDGRKVVHKETGDQLMFGIGKYGCIIVRNRDDWDLSVGGKRIDDAPSVFPVALHTSPPCAPHDERAPLRINIPPRLIGIALAVLVLSFGLRLVGRFGSASEPPAWREVASAEGGYTASLPGAAVDRVDTRTRDALTLTFHVASADVDHLGHFAILWADLPTDASGALIARDAQLATMCTLAADSALAAATELVASTSAPTLEANALGEGGALACRLHGTAKRARRLSDWMSLRSPNDNRLHIEVRGEIVGNRLYVRAAIVEPRMPALDLGPFFDGLHVTK